MSSQHHVQMQTDASDGLATSGETNLEPSDKIDLGKRFCVDMGLLCMNERYADVVFIVEEQRLPAHRVILAARSEYFHGLLDTTQCEIPLEVPLAAFKVLLRYIYSGKLSLSTLDMHALIDTLLMAKEYVLQDLEMAISNSLRCSMTLNNVCTILDTARLFKLAELTEACLLFMDGNAMDLLQHESFAKLTQKSLEQVLQRDSFCGTELDIFLAVWNWSCHNPHIDIASLVSYVRWPLSLANLHARAKAEALTPTEPPATTSTLPPPSTQLEDVAAEAEPSTCRRLLCTLLHVGWW